MTPSSSTPLINAQACDAEMKKAEFSCNSSTACGQPTASSLKNSGDNKTVATWALKICVGLHFSTQKTVW